jgi:hypothetical protein
VDVNRLVAELEAERNHLDTAIAALKRLGLNGTSKGVSGRRRLSIAARKRLSELMKKRWASGKMKRRRK